jgi:arylsulfatase A-like enzyme/tetratricopeptide (TPR) repeat protein
LRPLRYTVIVGLVSLGTALSAVGGWRYARASAPVSGPIVLLSVDALRADRLPAYGYTKGATPAIDALARDGVVFERAYSHAPQTLPAHASLLSGRLPFETGVRDSAGFTVKKDERLLAEVLADRGYRTAAVVSSYALSSQTGIAQGFGFFDDELPEAIPGDPASRTTRDGAKSIAVAEDWLGAAGTERAFLFIHLQKPTRSSSTPAGASLLEPYDHEVAQVDESIGRFVKYLKAHQLYDQSTIILIADHGEGLGDHGEQGHGVLAHEGVLRIPLIIKNAAGEGAGRRITALVQHVDIVPTILDLAKAPLPDRISGRSLKPLLDGDSDSSMAGRVVYSESLFSAYRFGWSAIRSVTDGRFRLIRADGDSLYDVASGAPIPLAVGADEHRAALERLREVLDRMLAEDNPPPPAPVSDVARTRLAALGYVGRVRPIAPSHPGLQAVAVAQQTEIVEAYRDAVDRALSRELASAIQIFEALVRKYPKVAALWQELGDLAIAAGRLDRAVDAYRRAAALRPDEASDRLAAAEALIRLRRFDEARQQAEVVLTDSVTDAAAAHALLARIAVLKHDPATAREHAAAAQEADPTLPMIAYIEGRLLADAGRHEEAAGFFDKALVEIGRTAGAGMYDLHYFAAETMVRLERSADAEYHLLEELRAFPQNVRARGALATLYHLGGRSEEAEGVLAAMTRVTPSPEAFALAARLWTTFGNPAQAAAVRAEAARLSTARPSAPAPAQ